NNEPSLQRILDLFQIPDNVGDTNPADTTFPVPPSLPNDEVTMQRLMKAGDGNVTVDLLAVFDNAKTPATKFGYYFPGTNDLKTELFIVPNSTDSQSVNPQLSGITGFDPGSALFSIYGVFPAFTNREVYSEDSLNTWEPNAANRRKVRFYPLKNSDGTVVPNAYIFAFEEYTLAYDQNDVVGIIRNVKAAAAGPEIGLQNLDPAPFPDRLMFSRITTLDATVPNIVHDKSTLRIKNTGDAPLNIASLVLTGAFVIDNAATAPTSIALGSFLDVRIKFTGSGQDITNGSLTINSDDADEPAKKIQLVGCGQSN